MESVPGQRESVPCSLVEDEAADGPSVLGESGEEELWSSLMDLLILSFVPFNAVVSLFEVRVRAMVGFRWRNQKATSDVNLPLLHPILLVSGDLFSSFTEGVVLLSSSFASGLATLIGNTSADGGCV